MPSPVQRTAIRGCFLDFKNCVSQADQISEQVRYRSEERRVGKEC